MKTKITGLLTFLIGTFFFYSCDTDVEALEIQKLKTYDEQYFENLRAFKKSDHEISYAYYEAWSPIEGVTVSRNWVHVLSCMPMLLITDTSLPLMVLIMI